MDLPRRSMVLAALLLLAGVNPLRAATPRGWFLDDLARSIAVDTKRYNCWPKPFLYPERQAVREPMFVMIANGWQQQNTLSDYHFEPTTGALNGAGTLKVRWILEQAPRHHRQIFVHRGSNAEETAARIDAIQQVATQVLPQGELPPVVETIREPDGWPSDRVDMIGRKFAEAVPVPQLPVIQRESTEGQ